jgi:iron complex outermembrane recepter protein
MKRNQLALSLAGLLLAPAPGAVFAQSTAPQDQQSTTQQQQAASPNVKQLQTITVTGSALPRVDTETPSPVTVITAQQIARSGYTTISDVVRSISADNSGSIPNAFSNGFAAGASGVALRGLTVNSTLVLIDGHRVANYAVSDDGQRSFVDLNTIPLAAVERVEVLKDGASSIYGADAIAGVVNIILKPNFKGVEATGDVGTSQHGGGFTRKATFLAGGGDLDTDHYNGYFSVQYQKDNEIRARQRGFPQNTGDLSSIGGSGLGGAPGRGAGPNGAIQDPVSGLWQPLQPCTTGPLVTVAGEGSWCRFDAVNYNGQIQPAMEQGGIYGRITIKLNDTTRAYLSASYNQSKLWAPTPSGNSIQTSTPINTNNITLPATNPANPFGAPALISYNFGDIPSGFNYNNHSARLVGGVSGTLGDWNYDVTGVINHTWLNTKQYGFITYSGLINAINNNTYNFVNPGLNSSAVRQSIAPGYEKTSTSDMDTLDFSANRQLWDLPGGPMGLAVGAQVRHEAQNDPTLNPDSINPLNGQPTLEFQGLGNAHTKGSRDVSGVYAEFDMPLLESLELDASGRFDHYSDVGNNFSPKIGFKWKPLDWVAIRGTYSKGFRAPSFAENGSSASQGFVTYQAPASFQAMHSAAYNLPYALAEFTQANPNIKPEKAKNFTFGVVLQPATWLSASIDYYNIRKSNVIVAADTSSALAAYYAGSPQAPGVIVVPDVPDTGAFAGNQPRPAEVIGEYVNANSLKTTGVDLDLQARFNFADNIRYTSELTATQIFEWKMQFPDGTVETYVGTQGPYNLSSGAGTPRTRASWANTIEYGPLTVTGTLYFTSSYANIAEDVGVGPGACLVTAPDGSNFPLSCRTGPTYEFDLTASYAINDHISVTGSIMNLFDRAPPFDPADYSGAGMSYNPTWSQGNAIGRFFNLGVKVKI